jgi:hypothetical protein
VFSHRKEQVLVNNSDKLLFSKKEFDQFFPKCMELLNKVQKQGVDENDIVNLKNNQIIPQEYKNLLSIPLAYLALKANNLELVNNCEEICTNNLLLTIWTLWKKEISKKQ